MYNYKINDRQNKLNKVNNTNNIALTKKTRVSLFLKKNNETLTSGLTLIEYTEIKIKR